MKKPEYLDRGLEYSIREIFTNASSAIMNYDNPYVKFAGVHDILPLFDDNKFKDAAYNHMQTYIKEYAVPRQYHGVFNYELVKGEALDPNLEGNLLKNLEVNKEKFEEYALSKKDSILSTFKDFNGNKLDDLLREGKNIIKHHDYTVSNVTDKIGFQLDSINTSLSEDKLKELAKSIYIKDIDYQISNANHIQKSGINEFKETIHSDLAELKNFKNQNETNDERGYGRKLTQSGYDILAIKLHELDYKKNNIEQEFGKFYNEIYPSLENKINKNDEKMGLFSKLKNAFGIDEIDYGPAKNVLDRSVYSDQILKEINESKQKLKM